MKHFLCCLALLCLFASAPAQSSNKSNSLTIGDRVPDVTLTNMINHSSREVRLSDYKGKLLIIDFWATWCAPCIAAFPKTDSLRKDFASQLEILPVTYQSADEVYKLFNKSRLKGLNIPMATSDKQLQEMFPHNQLPHYVWIDRQGKVLAITGADEVNSKKIRSVLEGASTLKEKKDRAIASYNREVPLMYNDADIRPEDIRFEVLFTGYKDGFASRFDIIRYTDKSIARYSATNKSLYNLFAFAFSSDQVLLTSSRISVQSGDSIHINVPFKDRNNPDAVGKWKSENSYCLELILPQMLSKDFHRIMRENLLRLFPQFKVGLEKQEVNCLVLERTSTADKLKTAGQVATTSFDHFESSITNGPLGILVTRLGSVSLQHLKTPVIDQTGYTGNIDISLKGNMSNVDDLRRELQKYDLDLVQRQITIDMLVIRDAN